MCGAIIATTTQRPRLAGAIQGVSDPGGRALADGAALRRAQSAAARIWSQRAEHWPWSSLPARRRARPSDLLAARPVPLPRNWLRSVNEPQTEAELAALRTSIVRGTPFGSAALDEAHGRRLGLESTLRPRGRPRKPQKVECPLWYHAHFATKSRMSPLFRPFVSPFVSPGESTGSGNGRIPHIETQRIRR